MKPKTVVAPTSTFFLILETHVEVLLHRLIRVGAVVGSHHDVDGVAEKLGRESDPVTPKFVDYVRRDDTADKVRVKVFAADLEHQTTYLSAQAFMTGSPLRSPRIKT